MKYLTLLTIIVIGSVRESYSQVISPTDSTPVRVSFFNVAQNNNKTILHWKVVCYLNYANFDVQRSTNGTSYTTINTFTADRFRCQSPFDFEDAISPNRTFYRLRVGDKDGNFATSKVLVAFGKEKSFEINSITPSLISSNALLSISSANIDKADILITNYHGRLLKRVVSTLNKGLTEIKLNLNELPKGLYIISVRNSLADIRTTRIIKL
jgi:hypothetical protein